MHPVPWIVFIIAEFALGYYLGYQRGQREQKRRDLKLVTKLRDDIFSIMHRVDRLDHPYNPEQPDYIDRQ